MIDRRTHRLQDFNLHAAAHFPGPPFGPSDAAVNIGEAWPEVPIRINFPGLRGTRQCFNRVLKMVHASASPAPSQLVCEVLQDGKTGPQQLLYLYYVILTL